MTQRPLNCSLVLLNSGGITRLAAKCEQRIIAARTQRFAANSFQFHHPIAHLMVALGMLSEDPSFLRNCAKGKAIATARSRAPDCLKRSTVVPHKIAMTAQTNFLSLARITFRSDQ